MVGVRARQLSQRHRRVLVLAEYAGLFSYLTVTVFMDDAWWWLLALVGVVAMILIHSQLLVRFTQKIANKEDAELDERQTAVRDNAHRTAYQILGSAIIVGLVLLQMLTTGPLGLKPWTPQLSIRSVVTPALSTLIWMYVSLPTAVIAWAEPDPDPDE
jgi:amino acid permease